MLVPVLLQLALIIFLAGLTILLWNLHNVVAAVETAFVGTLFLFLITVTILPAYRWDCCYRSPQALMVYTIVSTLRNRLTSALQRCIKLCSAHTSSKFLPARLWWSTLQKCCGMLSRTQTYRTWQAQERIDLRAQSEALNIETAVTAYTKTLDPASLDRMRIVLSGEPGRPLVRCLQALNIGANDGTVAPAALLKRNARGILSRLVLYALRQMLTVERKAREKGTKSGVEWENLLQMLLTVHTETLADGSIPRDELTLKTAFRVLMEATSTANQYSALRYLEAAVNIEAPTTCSYSTVWHVLSAAEQWIEKQQSLPDEPWISALPQINMYTFYIVVHCMLCVMQGKTTVPAPEETHFHNLCERAKAALCSLPKFLPVGSALVDHQTGHALCDQLSFGLQLLLAPLTLLSASMDAPDPQFRNAYKLVGAPSVIETEVVTALEQAWETARIVLELPSRPDVEESKAGLGITTRLTALRTDVGSLFMSFGLVLSG
ncbi:hypothetical protein C8Q79DRAFT_930012 [Trametes meyenii]|nr:hypothetical protein C8Q79DRAFT_930012 [Trametes meyenii]